VRGPWRAGRDPIFHARPRCGAVNCSQRPIGRA